MRLSSISPPPAISGTEPLPDVTAHLEHANLTVQRPALWYRTKMAGVRTPPAMHLFIRRKDKAMTSGELQYRSGRVPRRKRSLARGSPRRLQAGGSSKPNCISLLNGKQLTVEPLSNRRLSGSAVSHLLPNKYYNVGCDGPPISTRRGKPLAIRCIMSFLEPDADEIRTPHTYIFRKERLVAEPLRKLLIYFARAMTGKYTR